MLDLQELSISITLALVDQSVMLILIFEIFLKSQQLGVPNQVLNLIFYVLGKSQDLGMRCQKGLGLMQFSPNILKARSFLYHCMYLFT